MSGFGGLVDGGPAVSELVGGVVPLGVADELGGLLVEPAEEGSSQTPQPALVIVRPDEVVRASCVGEGVPLAGSDEASELSVVIDELDDGPDRVGRLAGLGLGEPRVAECLEVGATVDLLHPGQRHHVEAELVPLAAQPAEVVLGVFDLAGEPAGGFQLPWAFWVISA